MRSHGQHLEIQLYNKWSRVKRWNKLYSHISGSTCTHVVYCSFLLAPFVVQLDFWVLSVAQELDWLALYFSQIWWLLLSFAKNKQNKQNHNTRKSKQRLVSEPVFRVTDQSITKCHHFENLQLLLQGFVWWMDIRFFPVGHLIFVLSYLW